MNGEAAKEDTVEQTEKAVRGPGQGDDIEAGYWTCRYRAGANALAAMMLAPHKGIMGNNLPIPTRTRDEDVRP